MFEFMSSIDSHMLFHKFWLDLRYFCYFSAIDSKTLEPGGSKLPSLGGIGWGNLRDFAFLGIPVTSNARWVPLFASLPRVILLSGVRLFHPAVVVPPPPSSAASYSNNDRYTITYTLRGITEHVMKAEFPEISAQTSLLCSLSKRWAS
jgi:hypothetical protein